MAHLLLEAAKNGDVNFLRDAASDDSFFTQCVKELSNNRRYLNIFDVAARHQKLDFFKEAMKLISKEDKILLLFKNKTLDHWTVLHTATLGGEYGHTMVKLIIEFYTSLSIDDTIRYDVEKPWLALTKSKETPLHFALLHAKDSEKCAMTILSKDEELLSTMVDADGNTPLYLAVKGGFNQVAEKILISCPLSSSTISGENGSTALHVAPCSSEKVWRLLLKKGGDYIDKTDNKGRNALHVWADKYEKWLCNLLLEIKEFPEATAKIFQNLIRSSDLSDGDTPLHMATRKQDPKLAQLLVQAYQQYAVENQTLVSVECSPWRVKNKFGDTPLHLALNVGATYDELAVRMLTIDPTICRICNNQGESPFFLAVRSGCVRVMDKILKIEEPRDLLHGDDGLKVVHNLPSYSENVWRLLLKNCGDCIDKTDINGNNALHVWANFYGEWLHKLLLEISQFPKARAKIFGNLICSRNLSYGDTPLHIAAEARDPKVAQMLVQCYRQYTSDNQEVECPPPWRIKDKFGDTPLHIALALGERPEEFAVEMLSIDPTLCWLGNNDGESPLFLAVRTGCERVVEEILRIGETSFDMLRRNDGQTVLHNLRYCSERTARRLLGKYWWIINLADDNGKTALDIAKEENVPWLVTLLTNPSHIQKESFDWVSACKRGDTQAVFAFIDHCQDLRRTCREENDTPLHHIRLPTYKDYLNFLKIPSIAELKNTTDHKGATPLHRALERKDMLLAKALLIDDEVERDIPDNSGITAMQLLAKLCKENDNWEIMCEDIKVNPFLKTSYIHHGTNLDQMRGTLSVVAALLATITFAAGFTLPGGLDSNTGKAILAKKAAFLVFLLADVYAMCTSMLVLFCLIWSMISKPDMARLLVDRSVIILMQALYSTLLAFMTGIYTVIAKRSLWAAILIFVMCSIVGVSANRTILPNVIEKLIPATNKDKGDRIRLLEEGRAGASST